MDFVGIISPFQCVLFENSPGVTGVIILGPSAITSLARKSSVRFGGPVIFGIGIGVLKIIELGQNY